MKETFVYATDIHYGAHPITRTDDYNASILKKLEAVLSHAKARGATVLLGGDLFDTPKIKFLDFNQLTALFYKYRDLKIFCLHGNEGHDGFYETSPLTCLKNFGLIEKHDDYIDCTNARIIFHDHPKKYLTNPDDFLSDTKTNILMTHETLTELPVIFEHTLFDEYVTNADLVLVAHYHAHQGIYERADGVLFIAPGALARRKKVKHDIGRTPHMVEITALEGGDVEITEIELPCEQNIWVNREITDIQDNFTAAEIAEEVKNMLEIIDASDTFLSLEDSLTMFAAKENSPKHILEYCLKGLKEV